MDGSGTLTLRTSLDGDYVRVEIGDTGPGVPAENRQRIFEPFFTTKPWGREAGWDWTSPTGSSSSGTAGTSRSIRHPGDNLRRAPSADRAARRMTRVSGRNVRRPRARRKDPHVPSRRLRPRSLAARRLLGVMGRASSAARATSPMPRAGRVTAPPSTRRGRHPRTSPGRASTTSSRTTPRPSRRWTQSRSSSATRSVG